MKRIISLMSIICLLMCAFAMSSSAADNGSYTFIYDDREITVENPELSYEEMKAVADAVAGVETENEVSPCGILCIFGHKISTSSVTETIHNAYTTTPKCVENIYDVESCTRTNCDYIVKTLIDSSRIATCHG